ncbi:mechanosensitive ion channel [candidate division KSB1 bacterium]|nr:mechanosensitive ion channel [candidate division KSB1 bacterium]
MDKIQAFVNTVKVIFSTPVFSAGNATFTIWTLVYLVLLFFLLQTITSRVIKLVVYKVFVKSKVEIGVRLAIGSIIKYAILTIGSIVILQTVGINLSSLTILFGALGVGVGFGLQNITNNFVSGLIILFERPIKVGDRIEVGGVSGDVVRVSMRATTIITNDNISIIVPNSEFISSTVINWSHHDRNIRFNFKVGVSYKEDPEKIKDLLLQVANENPGVQKFPAPDVLFDEYSDSALIFNLRVWTSAYIDKPGVLKSQLYYEIFNRFKEAGVEIPFPQRDVYIKQMPASTA